QHPTIAELAAIEDPGPESDSGQVPLLPFQRAFFESARDTDESPGWALLLEVDPAIKPAVLEKGLLRIVASHEALRLVFEGGSPPGHAIIGPAPTQVKLEVTDIGHLVHEDRLSAIKAAVRRLQVSLMKDQASKVNFALFE